MTFKTNSNSDEHEHNDSKSDGNQNDDKGTTEGGYLATLRVWLWMCQANYDPDVDLPEGSHQVVMIA